MISTGYPMAPRVAGLYAGKSRIKKKKRQACQTPKSSGELRMNGLGSRQTKNLTPPCDVQWIWLARLLEPLLLVSVSTTVLDRKVTNRIKSTEDRHRNTSF